MSYFEDMIRRLEEIVDIKELNLKLMQTLEDALLWVIVYSEREGIPLENTQNLSQLLEQVNIFMRRVNRSPPFLQHRKRTPEDATEPRSHMFIYHFHKPL